MISSDNQFIVSGSNDLTIKIWKVESGECLKTLESKLRFCKPRQSRTRVELVLSFNISSSSSFADPFPIEKYDKKCMGNREIWVVV